MADVLATLLRFQQFVFEYGPFFLASWLGLALTTGLIAVSQRKWVGLSSSGSPGLRYRIPRWVWHCLSALLWRSEREVPAPSTSSGRLLFSRVAPVSALVVTFLIGTEAVLLRLILTVIFVMFLSWFVASVIRHKLVSSPPQQSEAGRSLDSGVIQDDSSAQSGGLGQLVRVSWKSFTAQFEEALWPLVIGFILAAGLTIYVPAYVVRPWLAEGAWQGPYLAALLVMPWQLVGGAEVPLASALLVKGASLGTALSALLAAPGATFLVIHRWHQLKSLRAIALYLVAVWLAAGSLGAVVNGVQRLLTVRL